MAKISSKVIAVLKNILIFAPANEKGAIAQLVEQRTENPCVPGSIPGGTTFLSNRNVAQLVAHYVRDVGVGRSSRLIPTIKRVAFCFSVSYLLCFKTPTYYIMKNRSFIFTAVVASLLCVSCTKTQTTLSENERPFNPPIMGWSSWNAFLVDISEDIIKHQADLMVEKGLKDAGYQYINVDDGYFGKRDENGVMQANEKRFPNGMKPVADHIHSLGMKAGLYTDAGTRTCGSLWNKDSIGIGAGIYGHEPQDAQLYFGDWGFDFIKIDYCGGEVLGLDEKERYTSIRNSIDKVNKNVSINICRWAYPGTWAKDAATSWRISGDINAHWNSLKYVVGKNLYLSAYAGNGHYNDMDMMVIGFRNNSRVGGNGLTPTEEEAHFGLWCIMSSPLLIGCDLEKMPDSSLELLKNKELIALNQDPLGLQAYVAQHENEGYVLVKDIEQKRGNVRAVALYNPSDTVCRFSVPFSSLEFGGNVKVRDLVRHSDLGSFSGIFEQTLPAHSAMFLRMEGEARLEPTLYEAEWAYLPLFNDLGKNAKGIQYAYDKEASGKMKVGFLGGKPENYAEWREVYSENGGRYHMTIHYSHGKGRQIEVDVNGIITKISSLEEDDNHSQISIPVELKAGYNTIRIGNSYDWAPDIDCFTLTKTL